MPKEVQIYECGECRRRYEDVQLATACEESDRRRSESLSHGEAWDAIYSDYARDLSLEKLRQVRTFVAGLAAEQKKGTAGR